MQWRALFSPCSCTASASAEESQPVLTSKRFKSTSNPNLILVAPVPIVPLILHPALSDDHKQELREAFQLFDVDGNGTISVDEIDSLLRKFNIKLLPSEMQTMLHKVDGNGDGQIDFEEFCLLMTNPVTNEITFEAELKEAFGVFDRDGDGFIDAQELMNVLTNIGEAATEEEIGTMIAEADLNGDGKMDWDEFVKVMSY